MRSSPSRVLAVAGLLVIGGPGLAADAPAREVMAESVDYPGSEGEMPARLYVPRGTDRLPGVLVLHTIAGPGPNVEAFARRLAGQGFVTMTPDVFALHEFGPAGRTDHPLILRDLDGAVGFLRGHPRVDPTRTGVVGFSFGGRLAVIGASRHPDLKAVVAYYAISSHAELARSRPLDGRALTATSLTELVPSLRAPVLLHHGEADEQVPHEQSRLLVRALAAAGKPATLHLYPGARHLFNFAIAAEDPSPHHPEADGLAWDRTLAFLRGLLAH